MELHRDERGIDIKIGRTEREIGGEIGRGIYRKIESEREKGVERKIEKGAERRNRKRKCRY